MSELVSELFEALKELMETHHFMGCTTTCMWCEKAEAIIAKVDRLKRDKTDG